MKFKSKAEEETVKKTLEEGKKTKFWQLIVQAMKESKVFIQQEQDGMDIAELPPEQYKFRNELFKAKKQFLDQLVATPDNIASWLGQPNNDRKEFDPYDKPDI